MKLNNAWLGSLLLVFWLTGVASTRADDDQLDIDEEEYLEEASLDEIGKQLENPLTSLWSLTFQENYSIIEGDAIDGDEWANNLFFQPALPVPVGANKDKVLIVRPVFPWVRTAIYDPMAPGGVSGSETGFGDMQVFAMIGPNRMDGMIWGVGATFNRIAKISGACPRAG